MLCRTTAVTPPQWLFLSQRGLRWLTPSGSFTVPGPSQRIRWNKYGRLLRRPRTPTSSSLALFSNHGRSGPRLSEQRPLFVFVRAFFFRRVPPCACAAPLMSDTANGRPGSLICQGPPPRLAHRRERGIDGRGARNVFLPPQSWINSRQMIFFFFPPSPPFLL